MDLILLDALASNFTIHEVDYFAVSVSERFREKLLKFKSTLLIGKNISFIAYNQKTADSDRNLSFSTKCAGRRVKFAVQVKFLRKRLGP